jgi:hypothetical protein
MIQQPKDLDAAGSLAILQEEVLDNVRRKDSRRREPSNWVKPYTVGTVSAVPCAAGPNFKPRSTPTADDRRGVEAARARGSVDKISALRSYRRARGECFTCGEKWGPTQMWTDSANPCGTGTAANVGGRSRGD